MPTTSFVRRVFAIFAINASFLRAIANLIQFNVQYIYSVKIHLLPKQHCRPQDSQKVHKSQQMLTLRQNSVS